MVEITKILISILAPDNETCQNIYALRLDSSEGP